MYTHILLPTDGSEVAATGIQHGIDLATRLGAKVTIITVTEPLTLYVGAESAGWSAASALADYDEHQTSSAKSLLATIQQQAEAAGLDAKTLHVPRAQPANSIVDAARDQDCDLIVMASHGRRGFRRLILGSQTAEVLARTSVPVLVVASTPTPS